MWTASLHSPLSTLVPQIQLLVPNFAICSEKLRYHCPTYHFTLPAQTTSCLWLRVVLALGLTASSKLLNFWCCILHPWILCWAGTFFLLIRPPETSRAEVEFKMLCDALLFDTRDTEDKLFVAEDVAIPPHSSALSTVSCSTVADASALFTPSATFVCHKCSLLLFALLEVCESVSRLLVLNQLSCTLTLLRGDCIGRIQCVDLAAIINMSTASIATHEVARVACNPVQEPTSFNVLNGSHRRHLDFFPMRLASVPSRQVPFFFKLFPWVTCHLFVIASTWVPAHHCDKGHIIVRNRAPCY